MPVIYDINIFRSRSAHKFESRGGLQIRIKMSLTDTSVSEPIVFDDAAVTQWVQACSAEAAMRAEGAPIGELAAARTGVVAGLVSLIAPSVNPETAFALLALLLGESSAKMETEAEDPIPADTQVATVIEDDQTLNPDLTSS
jgi:hypothetical protein